MASINTNSGIKNSYTVIENKLMAGSNPVSLSNAVTYQNLLYLYKNKINVLINLTNKSIFEKMSFINYTNTIKRFYEEHGVDVEIYRLGIKDFSIPKQEYMIEILNTIDKSISNNKKVYVHCMGGLGRTGTVIGCYLISKNITENNNALNYISLLRTGLKGSSPETEKQRKMVENWKHKL